MVIMMVLTSATCTFAASKPTKYTFNWGEYFTQEARTVDCYYSDSYFIQNSSKYNKHLASASMAMSLTGTRSLKSENAIDALKKIGCKNIKYVNRSGSRAVVLGKKKLKNGSLIVINPKATYGFCEWDNNVYFDTEGDLAGYRDISEATYKKAISYVKKGEKVKFWIAGHSRGGGITNLVAKELSDKFGKKNVYAYCFDNPYTTTRKEGNDRYTNIHNVEINDSGASVLLPAYMGLDRYGVVDKVYTALDGQDADMIKMLRKISDCDYWSGSDFRWASIDTNLLHYLDALGGKDIMEVFKKNLKVGEPDSQEEFWNVALERLQEVMPDRKAFAVDISENAQAAAEKMGFDKAYTFERAARTLAVHLYDIIQYKDIPDHDDDKLLVGFKKLLSSKMLGSLALKIAPVISGKTPDILKCSSRYAKWVNTLCNELKLETIMTEEEQKDTKLMLATALEVVLKIVQSDFKSDHQLIGTVLYNGHRMYDCHVPVTAMAYLMADDSYYRK